MARLGVVTSLREMIRIWVKRLGASVARKILRWLAVALFLGLATNCCSKKKYRFNKLAYDLSKHVLAYKLAYFCQR